MLRYLEVPVGGTLVSCARCPRTPEQPRITAEDVRSAARDAVAAFGGAIALAGSDVFARDDWASLFDAARAPGATRVRVDAGAALLDAALAEEALAAHVRNIRVGVLDLETAPDVLAAARTFLERSREFGLKAVASALVPVCRHNLHHTPAIVTELAAAGVAHVTLTIADTTLPAAAAAPWLAAAADSGTVNRAWVRIEGLPAQSLPGYGIHFTEPFALTEGR